VRVRFQADADLNRKILLAAIRREPVIDFLSALQAGLTGLSDIEVLAAAARAGRVLVTHDCRTMPQHFAEFLRTSTSAGVVMVPQHFPIPDVVEQIILIWAASEAEEWVNRICRLPL
jgi:hypothetical protein